MGHATAAFGATDNPNSAHQMWSRWTFGIEASPRTQPSVQDVVDNARRMFAAGFHSAAGRVRCDQQGTYYALTVEVEGPPAHDPAYRQAVRRQIEERFIRPGFGGGARLSRFVVGILAGDRQDGSPPEQLIVLPTLAVGSASQG